MALYALRSYRETGSLLANFSTLRSGDILLAMTGFYAFAGKWGGPFVKTSWFIGLIMTMYLLFPLLSFFIRKRPHLSIGILFLISAVCRITLGMSDLLPERPLDWFPFCRIFEFSLGVYFITMVRAKKWDSLLLPEYEVPLISYIGELSFPLFLIHYPLLFVIPYLEEQGVGGAPAILIYLGLSLILSWIGRVIDDRVPRTLLLEKVGMHEG